ncbi:MAG: hypothetical protein AB1635_00930 [Acidobacteriota bacterium]
MAKILFITWHFGCLRNFDGALAALAARGHRVHLAATQQEKQGGLQLVEQLAAAHLGITVGWTPAVATQSARDVSERVRLGLDYLRYAAPEYVDTPRLRARAADRAPRGVVWADRVLGAAGRRSIEGGLRRLELALPQDTSAEEYLREQAPDIVLFTPLIGLGSPEVEYLAAARRIGLRTVFCVWSWDNLSSKSMLRDMPDVVTVWNETQLREAVELHRVPRARVVVTGAQCFDQWFGRTPGRSRREFAADAGLPDDRPFVLYVCSALFRGSPSEARFVRRWVEEVRGSGEVRLRDVPILIRPHPSRLAEWRDVTLDGLGPTVLFGSNPMTPAARTEYFDSMYYSAVVVGLNTSAMLESAIVGRPVLTLLLPEFAENQEGTLHFRYLLDADHGLLHAARDMASHIEQLAAVLDNPDAAAARSASFVAHFIRPHGRGVSATDRYVAAIEGALDAPAQPPAPARPVAPPLARWVVANADRWPVRALLLSPREHDELRRRAAHLRAKRREKLMRLAGDFAARVPRWFEKAARRRRRAAEERAIKAAKRAAKAARQRKKRELLRRSRRDRVRELVAQRLWRLVGGRPE